MTQEPVPQQQHPPPHEPGSAQYAAHQAQFQVENQVDQAQQEQAQDGEYSVEDGVEGRRYGTPPRNGANKIYCTRQECHGMTFDRRCEWTKHMDKHDRPYRCERPGCEKLRGFTYSGGLLRHQREVHKDHGGPKDHLMCPVPYCKRNTGNGFTRKENLNEHLRRVHRQVEIPAHGSDEENNPPVDPLMDAQHRSMTQEAAEVTEAAEAGSSTNGVAAALTNPYEPAVPTPAPIEQPPKKRQRRTTAQVSFRGESNLQIAALRQEVEELRRDNEEKDARISRLEQMQMMALAGQHQIQQNGTLYQPHIQQAQMQPVRNEARESPMPERITAENPEISEQMLRGQAQAQADAEGALEDVKPAVEPTAA